MTDTTYKSMKNKFNIGDDVFVIKNVEEKHTCNDCEGTKKVKYKKT